MCSSKTKQVFVLLLWFVFSEDVYFEFQITLKREQEILKFTKDGCTCKGTHVLAFQSSFQDFASVNE